MNCMKLKVILLFLFVQMGVNAQQVTIDGLKYYLYPEKHQAVIDNGNTWSGELEIPSEISYEGNDYEVKGMVYDAFFDCKELTMVKIPKTISFFVFFHYEHVGSAIAPYYYNVFKGCTALESVEVDKDNPIMSSVDGVLYSKDGTKLYCYPGGIKVESFVVPQTVTWIGGEAFAGNEHIVSVELPDTAKIINGLFCDCKKLEKVKFPDNLTSIPSNMFWGCTSLKTIEIPSGIKEIDDCVFHDCTSLKSIILPEGLISIGTNAFENCSSLKVVDIPTSVEKISSGVFNNCTSLKKVNIPEGVTRLLGGAFKNCTSLEELDLPASITWIGSPAFPGCKFKRLIIRSVLNERCLGEHFFSGMDTSTVGYTKASEVDKLQKLYEGTVCSLEVLGISKVETPSSDTSATFDLQGRCINGEPKRGLYIRNGKKVIK